jgi:hypothetical protein
MGLVPYERSLVNRLEGKPFAVLGVNADRDPDFARRVAAAKGINWRSWADAKARGGPITSKWRVRHFPVFYLIDHKGIIREYWPDPPDHDDLEQRIRELLKKVK